MTTKNNFTKVDMHRIERVINLNPLVTCSFVLSVADNNGELNNVSRFEFHNYNSGESVKVIGGRKKEFLNRLKDLQQWMGKHPNLGKTHGKTFPEIGTRFNGTEIYAMHRGSRYILVKAGKDTPVVLDNLVTLLEWYMEIRLPWIKKGLFNKNIITNADLVAEDAVIKFVRFKDSSNLPLAVSLSYDVDNCSRVFRILNGNSSLVLNDYAEQVPGKDSTTKQVIKRMSDVLLHILNYDQKSHAIDLFSSIDGVNPDLLMYKGYVSLSSDAKHRRVAMNYDQNIMCSKAHWIHERFFTKAVQQAVQEIVDNYYN